MNDEFDQIDDEQPWDSIVDLMSSLVLVLFLAVLFFILNYSKAEIRLEEKQEHLKQVKIDLNDLSVRYQALEIREKAIAEQAIILGNQKNQLHQLNDQLMTEKKELEMIKSELSLDKERLEKEKEMIQGKVASLATDKQVLLKDQVLLLKEKQYLNLQVDELKDKLMQIKSSEGAVLSEIAKALEDQNNGLQIDKEEGKIVMSSEILFEDNSATLKEEGKVQLSSVIASLMPILSDAKKIKMIEGIMIEGHTSPTGLEERNWDLSYQRANEARKHIFELPEIKKKMKIYQEIFFISAFGKTRPVYQNHQVNVEASRRIEIKLLFSQKQVKEMIGNIKLKEDL